MFTEKYLCWSLSLMELQTFKPATVLKRDSNTDVYLWILQKFFRKPNLKCANNCFWNLFFHLDCFLITCTSCSYWYTVSFRRGAIAGAPARAKWFRSVINCTRKSRFYCLFDEDICLFSCYYNTDDCLWLLDWS